MNVLGLLASLRPGGRRTFQHGVHPPEAKAATAGRAVERLPIGRRYALPLDQHIGAPARAIVAAGDRVARGQMVAEPVGWVSSALHAPVAGVVVGVSLEPHPRGGMSKAISIEADAWDAQVVGEAVDPRTLSPGHLGRRVQAAGIVGLGGAAFPSHVKLSVPEGREVTTVVINGCECEPYLTCDHRLMVERAADVVRGTVIIMDAVGAARAVIGVESNKPDAVEALRAAAPEGVEVVALEVKYPQGAEKMLVEAALSLTVPDGGLPLDVGVVVHNVGTAAALADLFDRGLPLIERVVTVTGPGITTPKNLLVPIGASVQSVIDHCGGLTADVEQVVLGGPMMGAPLARLDVPVLKGTSGILCLDRRSAVPERRERACIRCGRCIDACPMFLDPQRLGLFVRHERLDDLEAAHLRSCFECASCSFVCPSAIPLVQLMRVGKGLLRERQARERAAAAAP